jgi:hypothetical protein
MNQPSSPLCCCRFAAYHVSGNRSAGVRSRPFLRRADWHVFRTVLAGLRRRCPAAMPVVVRTSWLPDTLLGQCIRRAKRFVVLLNNQMAEEQAVEVLCHEWAHALAWNYSLDRLAQLPDLDPTEFDRASHDEAWGCAYARVWRAYLEA